jgi:hypothetical protein
MTTITRQQIRTNLTTLMSVAVGGIAAAAVQELVLTHLLPAGYGLALAAVVAVLTAYTVGVQRGRR